MANEDHPELVDLMTARTPIEAQIIAGVLAAADIPTYVPGGQLTDEFAMSQQILGLQSVVIRVRSTDIERARTAVASARDLGQKSLPDEQDESDDTHG